jgi:nucleoside-diphosphate-sugar epimerase
MRDWIKLFEDQDDDAQALYAREHYIEHMIVHTCAQAGMDLVSQRPILYDEQDNRTATIRVADSVTLEQLAKITHLGSGWTILGAPNGYGVSVQFIVDPKLDLGK